MSEAKDVMKVGATAMVGHGVLGGLAGVPGMPAAASHTTQAANAGLNLVAVGQMAKSGLTVTKSLGGEKKKKSGNKVVDKILGK